PVALIHLTIRLPLGSDGVLLSGLRDHDAGTGSGLRPRRLAIERRPRGSDGLIGLAAAVVFRFGPPAGTERKNAETREMRSIFHGTAPPAMGVGVSMIFTHMRSREPSSIWQIYGGYRHTTRK